ncbi:unnamed protein product [Orchesella dallaii]|uniref:Uncharacterized protein n=1 Tax=Orchesella dallaii TaxID=48710 RepID=A0ABP1RAC1_9HEXA
MIVRVCRFAKAKLMLKDHKAPLGLINGAINIEPFNRQCLQLKREVQESSEKIQKLTLEKTTDKIDWNSELNVPGGANCSEAQLEKQNSQLLKGSNTRSKQDNLLNLVPVLFRNFKLAESKTDTTANNSA